MRLSTALYVWSWILELPQYKTVKPKAKSLFKVRKRYILSLINHQNVNLELQINLELADMKFSFSKRLHTPPNWFNQHGNFEIRGKTCQNLPNYWTRQIESVLETRNFLDRFSNYGNPSSRDFFLSISCDLLHSVAISSKQ